MTFCASTTIKQWTMLCLKSIRKNLVWRLMRLFSQQTIWTSNKLWCKNAITLLCWDVSSQIREVHNFEPKCISFVKQGCVNLVVSDFYPQCARCCQDSKDFHSRTLILINRLVRQHFTINQLKRTFGKFAESYYELLAKYGVRVCDACFWITTIYVLCFFCVMRLKILNHLKSPCLVLC